MSRQLRIFIAAVVAVFLFTWCQAPSVQSTTGSTKTKTASQSRAKAKPSSEKSSPKTKESKQQSKSAPRKKTTESKSTAHKSSPTKQPTKSVTKQLPRLLDLGATKCIPCKMMAPILEELAREYKGKLKVEFIDVWENPDAARKYGIRVIPTQIFFDEKGEEFFRHEGFYSKQDILRKFRDQGIDLDKPSKAR